MIEKVKITHPEKTNILERGNIYFFYRPRVQPATDKKVAIVRNLKDIQRFYLVLHPDKAKEYRLILIGEKKLPAIADKHEKNWAMVDLVTGDRQALLNELNEKTYSTQTRGKRVLPSIRPADEGVYCIVKHGRNTYLAYVLELLHRRGEAQKALEIERQASYVLSVKNPDMPGKRSSKPAKYPKKLKEKFKNLRFIPAEPPELIHYKGAELLLIGAKTQLKNTLGIEINKE